MKDKYKTLITACWLVLISCFIVKLLGGNWFEIACSNEKFIRFCNWFKVGSLQYYILSGISYIGIHMMIIASILKHKLGKDVKTLNILILLISVHLVKSLLDKYTNVPILLTIIDIILYITTPFIFNGKKRYRGIIGFLLILAFQFISLLVKNVSLRNVDNNVFTSLIFMIDYYIMVGLYYLYSTREENENGTIWWFISRFRKRRNH